MAKILVVDDDHIVRRLLVTILGKTGHEVEAFDDGKPVLEMTDFTGVDLLITDLNMPTSGEEIIRAVRKTGSDVPIIVCSGWVNNGDMDPLTCGDVQGVLRKPFRIQNLLELAESCIQIPRLK